MSVDSATDLRSHPLVTTTVAATIWPAGPRPEGSGPGDPTSCQTGRYHVHFWSALPLHVAMRIAALLADDAAARHSVVFPIGRIVPSERNCQVCAIVLLHV